MASVQLLQLVNTSVNFPIYWFVGNFRETFLNLFCGTRGFLGNIRKKVINVANENNCPDENTIEMESTHDASLPSIFSDNTKYNGFAYEKLLKPPNYNYPK